MIGQDHIENILRDMRTMGAEVARLNRETTEQTQRIADIEQAVATLLKKARK